jgi:hypothetical protein
MPPPSCLPCVVSLFLSRVVVVSFLSRVVIFLFQLKM